MLQSTSATVQYSSSARKTTTTTRVTSLFEVSVEGSVAPPSASTPYSILFKTRADQICTYMLAVITFGLLGFASMSNSMHNHEMASHRASAPAAPTRSISRRRKLGAAC